MKEIKDLYDMRNHLYELYNTVGWGVTRKHTYHSTSALEYICQLEKAIAMKELATAVMQPKPKVGS